MGNIALRKWQTGIEVSYGAGGVAARKFYPTQGANVTKEIAFHTPNADMGSYDEGMRGRWPQLVEAGVDLSDVVLDTNMIIEILRMAVNTLPATGTQIGATGAYVWTFVPGDLASGFFEYDSAGQYLQAAGCMIDELTFSWGPAEPFSVNATILCRDAIQALMSGVAVAIDTTNNANDDTVTVNGVTFTQTTAGYDVGSRPLEWNDAAQLVSAINNEHGATMTAAAVSAVVTVTADNVTAGPFVNVQFDAADPAFTVSVVTFLPDFTWIPMQGWETQFFSAAVGTVPFATSAKPAEIVSGEITIQNNLQRKYFDDNTQLITRLDRGRRRAEASLTMDVTTNALAEYANWLNNVERTIGIRIGGNKQAGTDPANNHTIDITLPGIWTAQVIGESDEATTLELTMENVFNTTLGYAYSIKVTNTRAS